MTSRRNEWNDVHTVYKGMARSLCMYKEDKVLYMHQEDSHSTCTRRTVTLHASGGQSLYMHQEDRVTLHAPGG